MLMDPVVMGSADRDQVVCAVGPSLGSAQNMMGIDRAPASDLGDEALGSASSISGDDLLFDL